ncbi:hypothetical protein J6590_020505 [Homalodisca vitripennis]|nr:hypothetical protein J6590_020505 [Homalodisca vitripennis]
MLECHCHCCKTYFTKGGTSIIPDVPQHSNLAQWLPDDSSHSLTMPLITIGTQHYPMHRKLSEPEEVIGRHVLCQCRQLIHRYARSLEYNLR